MFGTRSGKLWARIADEVAALDDQGRVIARIPVGQPFQWFAVP